MKMFIAGSVVALLASGCGETRSAISEPPAAATTTTATPEVQATTDTATPQPATEVPQDTDAGDVTGPYFPTAPFSGEFAELDHLLLATIDDSGSPAPLNGFLRPKKDSAEDYELVQPALVGRNLTFTTAAIDGVHYAFNGAFTRLDNFAANTPQPDEVVLSGTLTKLRDGNSIATTPVSFAYQPGG
ncbi:MAG TPA: hypothetical protein VE974_23635 [Thermoanaerobaculia bacterium]|nr:hypothetical protein [Thermoanaerobaculia bacterium]